MVIGIIIGMGYFAGLWITVQVLPNAKRPVLTWGLSALVRVVGATIVFVILLRWGQDRAEGFDGFAPALAALAGFVLARFASTVIWGPTREPKIPTAERKSDADQQPDLKLEGDQDGESEK
ncbi:MAG: ATP synthase subunit I, partial [Armatimonadota bacterium]